MIQKYIATDTIVFIASDISYKHKDLYKYEWYVDGVLISDQYQSFYKFPKTGMYNIKLIIKDRESEIGVTTTSKVNIHLKKQNAV